MAPDNGDDGGGGDSGVDSKDDHINNVNDLL